MTVGAAGKGASNDARDVAIPESWNSGPRCPLPALCLTSTNGSLSIGLAACICTSTLCVMFYVVLLVFGCLWLSTSVFNNVFDVLQASVFVAYTFLHCKQ